ncbi:hypothetical protein OL548_01175 [Lysinibacillus sp. MHQ-1]|nr:hypothetical protein OL548_01175 [Lysinibacillus sp. MHQ-1]
MYRLLKPESGTVLLNEQDILKQSSKAIAKKFSRCESRNTCII